MIRFILAPIELLNYCLLIFKEYLNISPHSSQVSISRQSQPCPAISSKGLLKNDTAKVTMTEMVFFKINEKHEREIGVLKYFLNANENDYW